MLNYQDLGGGDLKDEIYGLDWLMSTGFVDPKKVGVFGGSYGGFMTLMLAAKEPDKFAAAVDLFGPLDWYTMMKNSDPLLNQYLRSLLGDPEKDSEVYKNDSPIKYVQNIRAPLLVLQGDNDPRVPKEETEQLVSILKKRGNVVDVVYYPDEGHGFDKTRASDRCSTSHRSVVREVLGQDPGCTCGRQVTLFKAARPIVTPGA